MTRTMDPETGQVLGVSRMSTDQLRSEVPAIDKVVDPGLREAVAQTWRAALAKGGYRSVAEVPQSAAFPGRCLLDHVNEVNALAVQLLDLAEASFGLAPDRDVTLAGAILHDVDKSFVQRLQPSGAIEYVDGYTIRDHGPAGAKLAVECGVPENVAELVRTHAPFNYEGHLPGTIEGTVVHYADLTAADFAAVQAGAAPIHARSVILKRDHPILRDAEVIDAY
jgi:putative nucleotidyltransferase with HDIG domain